MECRIVYLSGSHNVSVERGCADPRHMYACNLNQLATIITMCIPVILLLTLDTLISMNS